MSDPQVSTPRSFAAGPLRGALDVPGDKSISHRALILGAYAYDPLEIVNLNPGRDVSATLEGLAKLGAYVQRDGNYVRVAGGEFVAPGTPIDCMNSGSTARMLLGVCAGLNLAATFNGDESLRKRPMEPVAAQLRAFGAKITTSDGLLPLQIDGTPEVQTRNFILVTPSAQVKSALLLAGAFARTSVRVNGDRGSRDHTERLLRYLGADIEWNDRTIELRSGPTRTAPIVVPGDFSSASFFITAATLASGSELLVRNVNVNPTRTGLLDILLAMGAQIELRNERDVSGEPLADLMVRSAPLHGITIGPDLALRAIDEIPLVAVAAAFAQGDTKITGIAELRNKESDRVAAIERLLQAVGISAEVTHSGLVVHGGTPAADGAIVDTRDDHRIAMATAVLAAAAGPLGIDSDASIDVSFPAFVETLRSVQQG